MDADDTTLSSSTATLVPHAHLEEWRLTVKERLIALLAVYAPTSLPNINDMLTSYAGRERMLFRLLGRRFGIGTDAALSIGGCPRAVREGPTPPLPALLLGLLVLLWPRGTDGRLCYRAGTVCFPG
jgi:hypothetical protein